MDQMKLSIKEKIIKRLLTGILILHDDIIERNMQSQTKEWREFYKIGVQNG
jgi:hypothetical protein